MNFARLIAILAILFVLCIAANSQEPAPECPPTWVACLTQAEANQAASNAREVIALREKEKVLTEALAFKDASIRDLQKANTENVRELTAETQRLIAELARTTGQLTECQNDRTWARAFMEVLVKSTRKKSMGIIAF